MGKNKRAYKKELKKNAEKALQEKMLQEQALQEQELQEQEEVTEAESSFDEMLSEVMETTEISVEEASEELAEPEEESEAPAEEDPVEAESDAVEEEPEEEVEDSVEEPEAPVTEEVAEAVEALVAEEPVEESEEPAEEAEEPAVVETAEEPAGEELTEETEEPVAEEPVEEAEELSAEETEEKEEPSAEEAEEPAEEAETAAAVAATAAITATAATAASAEEQETPVQETKTEEKAASKPETKKVKKAAKEKKPPSTGKKIAKAIGITVLVIAIVLVSFAAIGLGVLYKVAQTAPEVTKEQVIPTMYPTTILDANGNQIVTLTTDGSNRAELTAEEITDNVRWSVIDIEDERFYEHPGVDIQGILRAIKTNLSSDRSEGASTITQQLIKNAVFGGGMETSKVEQILRKIREWKVALDLEKVMTKEEILVTYLNTINMGSGIYGIKQAARYYFNKELPELTISECAVLAAITQNPSANNPYTHPETNRERQLLVLNKMLERGHITQAQYDEAVADTAVYDRIQQAVLNKPGKTVYSYFTDSLIRQVLDDLQEQLGYSEEDAELALYAGGLTIQSTQNPTAQAIVDEELQNPDNYWETMETYSIIWNMSVQKADGVTKHYDQNMLSAYFRETLGYTDYKMDYWSPEEAEGAINEYKSTILNEGDTILTESVLYPIQPQVSFSVMDYTNGHVLAVFGGRGEKPANLTLSRATGTFRQPGSTFKPLASFGPAIDMGRASLETLIVDEPFTYPYSGKQVRNWWGDSYRGPSTVRDGIRNSMNIVAVKCLNMIGPENSIPYLQKMGFSTITMMDANLATALGGLTYGVSNLELAAAYAMIANNGVYIEPSFYTTIYNYDGSVLLERQPKTERVFQEYTTTLLLQALIDVCTSGTGTGSHLWNAPTAGKTGTTNDNRDIWFSGFIPNGLAACIWMGQDDNASLWHANLHQQLYAQTMSRIVEALGLEGGYFPDPGQEIKAICIESGELANEKCTNTEIRFYDYGGGPTSSCSVHHLSWKDPDETTTKKTTETTTEETVTTETQTETQTTTQPQTETTTTAAPSPNP